MPSILRPLISFFLTKPRFMEVTVNVSDEDWGVFSKISAALKKVNGNGTLLLEIVGLSRLHPTVALSLFELLRNRGEGVKLRVQVSTNLVDAALIFPILADELYVRKGAWFQFASAAELEKKAIENDKDGEGWKNVGSSRVNTVKESPAITDHRAMTTLLGEYLPMREFKGKRLPLEKTLRDHYLFPDPARDAELARQFIT